jgi:hypothetical protein
MKFEQSSPSTTTIKFEKEDQSIEETTSKPQQLVKTFSFIPGKITETKIFDNEASKAYFMRHPEQHQQQLSQGSTLLLFLLAALLFCACMMASVIAIVSFFFGRGRSIGEYQNETKLKEFPLRFY